MQIMLSVSLSFPPSAWQQPSPTCRTAPRALCGCGAPRGTGTAAIPLGKSQTHRGLSSTNTPRAVGRGLKSSASLLLKPSVSLPTGSEPSGSSGCQQGVNGATSVLPCPWQIEAVAHLHPGHSLSKFRTAAARTSLGRGLQPLQSSAVPPE